MAQYTPYNNYNYFFSLSSASARTIRLALRGGQQRFITSSQPAFGTLSVMGYQTYGKDIWTVTACTSTTPPMVTTKYGHVKTQKQELLTSPSSSLNHIWKIDDSSSLVGSLYAVICDAGGYSGQATGLNGIHSDWYGAFYRRCALDPLPSSRRHFRYGADPGNHENSTGGFNVCNVVRCKPHQW